MYAQRDTQYPVLCEQGNLVSLFQNVLGSIDRLKKSSIGTVMVYVLIGSDYACIQSEHI